MTLHAWTSARHGIPLPAGHRFPIEKYARLRDEALERGLVERASLHEPGRIGRDDLLRVHDAGYVDSFAAGAVAPHAMRRMGFPWSPELVERAYRTTGGTSEAADAALTHGVAINLAGGTHHAFADRGEGFCVFNDTAVALCRLFHAQRIRRAAIVDLDVHQGNGTHAIFAGDERVFTFSMHGRRNYPFEKVAGCRDVELEDGTGDAEYLERLEACLPAVLAAAAPDIVIYLAGADPHEGDRLGRLRLTFDGLARRDAIVLEGCRSVGIPVAVTIAGGYGENIASTVQVHLNTLAVLRDFT